MCAGGLFRCRGLVLGDSVFGCESRDLTVCECSGIGEVPLELVQGPLFAAAEEQQGHQAVEDAGYQAKTAQEQQDEMDGMRLSQAEVGVVCGHEPSDDVAADGDVQPKEKVTGPPSSLVGLARNICLKVGQKGVVVVNLEGRQVAQGAGG